MVPMAHGNDAGGSIRVPAACCGAFGFKPTRARNPLGPLYGEMMGGLIVEHALTRTVRDSARLLDATAGPDFGDPYEAPSLARPFAHEIGVEPGRLRVVFSTRTLMGEDVHPDCRAAVHDAARLLESLGHHVVEGTPPIDGEEFWRLFTSVLAAGFAWAVDDWSRRLNRRPVPEHSSPSPGRSSNVLAHSALRNICP
jgi:amidase